MIYDNIFQNTALLKMFIYPNPLVHLPLLHFMIRILSELYLVHILSMVNHPSIHLSFKFSLILGGNVTVGPAEPKSKPSTIGDYPSSIYKRAKPDHSSLRTLTPYGASSTHPHYGQTSNTDMMHTYYQQYNMNPTASPKGLFSNPQQTYWSGTHEEAAALWQQQHYQ